MIAFFVVLTFIVAPVLCIIGGIVNQSWFTFVLGVGIIIFDLWIWLHEDGGAERIKEGFIKRFGSQKAKDNLEEEQRQAEKEQQVAREEAYRNSPVYRWAQACKELDDLLDHDALFSERPSSMIRRKSWSLDKVKQTYDDSIDVLTETFEGKRIQEKKRKQEQQNDSVQLRGMVQEFEDLFVR